MATGAGTRSHRVVALGSEADVAGMALAGVEVLPALTAVETHRAWDALPAEVAVVLLTQQAAEDLGDARLSPRSPLSVVLPTGVATAPPEDPDATPTARDPLGAPAAGALGGAGAGG
jgi:vacuolar-type H+-ATPase subunit F/Vma7